MKSSKYLDHIGVEIEGGFKEKPKVLLENDGSLRRDEFYNSNYVGEIISPPLEEKEDLFKFMEENWPTEVTARCGFHFHFSLKSILFYTQLMSEKFYKNYFMRDMRKWGKDYPCNNKSFWSRLDDGNHFCRAMFIPDKQIPLTQKVETRYTHLNYCYAMHKTIECRLFPMFVEFETGQSAIETLINCIENYLTKNPPEELVEKIELEDENIIELPKKFKIEPFNLYKIRLENENVF